MQLISGAGGTQRSLLCYLRQGTLSGLSASTPIVSVLVGCGSRFHSEGLAPNSPLGISGQDLVTTRPGM